ncbi:tetratricopeptide repeat-containing sensor histidine kinase [Pedobacter aquatilis]|uniref:tetratricopeptide repeat-containing sensor histidine kinase n=1 Tax=Pedobacter aquatilis TaxID=351343 RepID=UPI002931C701|nr:tetratricopeptide repeat-containing sensor histidine kinase [Pedobacter aquatilis]
MRSLILTIFSFILQASCYGYGRSPADTTKVQELIIKSGNYELDAPKLSFELARQGLILARKEGYRLGEARALRQIARINAEHHGLIQSLFYQKQAVMLFLKEHAEAEAAQAYMVLGVLEGENNFQENGLRDVQRALGIYQKINSNTGILLCYQNIGLINENSGQLGVALENYKKARAFGKSLPISATYLVLLERLGGLYNKMDSDQRALETFREGINASKSKTEHRDIHINFLRHTAKVHYKTGNEDLAISYHRMALTKSSEQGRGELQVRSLMDLAEILKNHRSDEGIKHLQSALVIARQISNPKLAAEIYSSLSSIYRQQNRYKEALLTLEAHHNLLDSMVLINKERESEIIQGNYEIQNFRNDIQRLELSNKQKTFERNAGAVAIVIILLLLMFIGYHFYLTRKLNRRLLVSNRIKDKLFSIIGHDLRNPIGGMTTMLGMMEQKPLEAKVLKNISAMKKQSEIALEILSTLLKWGQAQLQGVKVNKTRFKAWPVVEKNIALLTGQANDKDIEMKNEVAVDTEIFLDKDHFDFIIRNLLSNAIKFTHPGGKVAVISKLINNQLQLDVIDTGIGMSLEQVNDFNKGSLESDYGTNGEKGTGIGLMLSMEYIRANQASINLVSNIGEGSAFSLNFPEA